MQVYTHFVLCSKLCVAVVRQASLLTSGTADIDDIKAKVKEALVKLH